MQTGDERWAPSREFLSAKLAVAQAEMATAILNRTRWEKVREESRLLTFLNRRTDAADFQGVGEELNRIADGRMRVPELGAPRTQAADCLRLWASALLSLDQAEAVPLREQSVVTTEY
jgi:hypothetical protein